MPQTPKEISFPAQEIVEKGLAALHANNPQDALYAFEQAAKADNPNAYYELAKLYFENRINLAGMDVQARLSLAKQHLQKSILELKYFPEKFQILFNKINEALLREILKTSLQRPFEHRDVKSFNSILTFLKADDRTRTKFNLLYEKGDQGEFEAAVKEL
ncbi:hypothetical protein FAI41_03985 [Acetobacteraceae bacterium]|nr:hypothetical protein FAI41_03985 [Acetobacteraceae bacterium]